MNDQQQSRADALTDDQRQALGEAISEYFEKLDSDEGIRTSEGRILRAFDYCDSHNVDDLIDRAILPALATSANETGAEGATWRDGVEAVAKMIEKKAADYLDEYGYVEHDTGAVSWGLGNHADEKRDYHSSLVELAEEVRAMAPAMAAAAPADETPEGCTPADARMLREANHALAAENDALRRALRPFAHVVSTDKLSWAMVEYCVEGDPEKQTFKAPQMQRAFNRAADMLRNESATQATSGEIDDVQVSRDGLSGGNPAVDSPARDLRLSSEPADERAATFEEWFASLSPQRRALIGDVRDARMGWEAARAAASAAAMDVTEAVIRTIAAQHCEYDADSQSYNILRYECEEDLFNCIHAILAARQPAQADAPVAVDRFPLPIVCDRTMAAGEFKIVAQADAPAEAREPAKIDTKARMDWADSIVRKLPPLDPTYSIISILDDHDPEDRDEVLHSIRTFADMRATQALFTLYSATADAGEAQPYAYVHLGSNYATANKAAATQMPVVPVYTAPPAARVASLTSEQKATINWAIRAAVEAGYTSDADVLRDLLNGADR
ncbi:hypothetical protein QZM62_12910 [Burkholderia multivorans]|nr:hypothetical protein [Burkholderia multivorans]